MLRKQHSQQCLQSEEVCFFLRNHGYHLDEKEIVELALQLFRKESNFTPQEAVGLLARLSID